MKKTRMKITRMVTILCAAIFVFACTTTVFGANDLVGRATGNGTSTSRTRTNSSSSSSASTTYNGSGSTSSVSAGTENTSSMARTVATGVYTKGGATGTAAAADPTTRRVTTQVQTGVFEKILPFVLIISAAFLVFWVFFHLQMNQVRYGKSEKYYKELLDFKVMCRN